MSPIWSEVGALHVKHRQMGKNQQGVPPALRKPHQVQDFVRDFEVMSLDTKTENLKLNEGAPGQAKQTKQPKQPKQPKQSKKAEAPAGAKKGGSEPIIGITANKETDFSSWYQQIVTKAELLDYYDVSGCYILRPASYNIWEKIQKFFDEKIKAIGVENAYFPMFVSQRVLEKEKDHVEGFAPEVAWVTRAGSSELEEAVAIRPTSETVMYPYYAKWIQSHRDLPLRLNQWNSVVRWEFKHPQPFLRTREFLWQEGHTAHLTREGAEQEVHQIAEYYTQIYKELLAVPTIKGTKTENEKFAGSFFSLSCEGYIPSNGRGIQGATSHCLGQNFSKMFNISVEDPDGGADKLFVWQNSWGFSTRSIGVMIMIHSDNKGLVLPPRAARTQVIVIAVGLTKNTTEEVRSKVMGACKQIESDLSAAGVLVSGDYRENYTPGFKFADAELKGIPLRIEVGPRDVEKGECVAVKRYNAEKSSLALADLSNSVPKLLDDIHEGLYANAKEAMDSHIVKVMKTKDMVKPLNDKNLLLIPFCGVPDCEEDIKTATARQSTDDAPVDEKAPSMGAKSLCTPFEQPELPSNTQCANCNRDAKHWTLFGRSY